jgi:hypothetical protein
MHLAVANCIAQTWCFPTPTPMSRTKSGCTMNSRLLLLLTAGVVACVGCIKISSTTTNEEISLSGPSLDGDGKVLDCSEEK